MKSILILFSTCLAHAENLGTFGATFPIAEENPVEMILKKLTHLSESGQLEQHQKNIQDLIKEKALNPDAVKGIQRAKKSNSRLYDPSITVPYDLKDQDGRIFHPAGTVVNPLKTHSLTKPLVFFNGEDPEQVRWALSQHHKNPRIKLILVQGSPFKLSETHDITMYFDQAGTITQKLGITEVPTMVTQTDDNLQIDTIALEEETTHDQ